ncbi:unnamed protein product [Cylicocyclus nassatus]|uniref:Uncharacterized protein n=1 Tax=Cylicocyclus nassatus TaxID=53992 RepID=A0AA36M8C4_CYLNA|nr:unnamed protein product [Cylicocyclus nassatus]
MDFENAVTVTCPLLELPEELQSEVLRKDPLHFFPDVCDGGRKSDVNGKKNSQICLYRSELERGGPRRKNTPAAESLDYDKFDFGRLFHVCDIDMLHIVNSACAESDPHSLVLEFVASPAIKFYQLVPAAKLIEHCIMTSRQRISVGLLCSSAIVTRSETAETPCNWFPFGTST